MRFSFIGWCHTRSAVPRRDDCRPGLLMEGLLFVVFMSCSRQVVVDRSVRDSVTVQQEAKVIGVDQLPAMGLEVGESVVIPDLQMKLLRISQDSVLVQRPVKTILRQQVYTRFVPTREKLVDKSDHRIHVGRTYRDSNNSTRWGSTKVKDKSNSGVSGNKITLGPWVWIGLFLGLAYQFRKHIKKILGL